MTDPQSTTTVGRRGFLKVSGAVLGGIAAGSTVVAAESTDRYIVDLRGGRLPGVEVVHDLSQIGYAVVRASTSDLKRSKAVTDFVPDTTYHLSLPVEEDDEQSATDEPFYPLQWDKQDQNIPEVQGITRGEGTRVAVIDTGVAAGHPDLTHAVNTDLSENFTEDDFGAGVPAGGDHGTHVAGIVAADDANEEGVVGSAPGTEIVDCRVFSPGALAFFGDILAAMVYAAQVGCDAANMSIGAYPVSRKGIGVFYGKALNRTTAYGMSQGTLYVVSAGNASADLQHDGRVCVENEDGSVECFAAISLPNEAANVLSISATGPIGYLWDASAYGEEPPESPAFYTNYGTNAIDLAAPGGDASLEALRDAGETDTPPWFLDLVFNAIAVPEFRTEDVDDDDDEEPVEYLGATYGYGWKAGTSMAAPQVAGAAALVKSVDPDANPNQIRQYMKNAASVPDDYDKTYYGAGYLNTLDAVLDAR